jgi:hypothetical protein
MSLVFDLIARLGHDVGKLHWVMMLENSTPNLRIQPQITRIVADFDNPCKNVLNERPTSLQGRLFSRTSVKSVAKSLKD